MSANLDTSGTHFKAVVRYLGDGEVQVFHLLGRPDYSDNYELIAERSGFYMVNRECLCVRFIEREDGASEMRTRVPPDWWSEAIRRHVLDEMAAAVARWKGLGDVVMRDGTVITVPPDGVLRGGLSLRAGYSVSPMWAHVAHEDALAELVEVTGSVDVSWRQLHLPQLRRIGGSAFFWHFNGNVDRLEEVDGDLFVSYRTRDLPALRTVGGRLEQTESFTGAMPLLYLVNQREELAR